MKIVLDENNSIPNYKQIIIQIKRLIIREELKPHDQLPSIRVLSKDLNIAIVTVKRAYEELEKEGITYTISGKGVYIKELDLNALKFDLILDLKKEFRELISLARYFYLRDEEILASFQEELLYE